MIRETCSFILDELGGNIPADMESLLRIPNIGPYTAGAILSLGFGIRAPMVDSNVERILKKLFLNYLPDQRVNAILRKVAEVIVPEIDHQTFNLAFVDLGSKICTYRKTHCKECPLKKICDYSCIKE